MKQNRIPTAYFREQEKYYSFDSFKSELCIDDDSVVQEIIERLRYRKLIKPTNQEKFNNAAVDEDFEEEINIGKIAPGSSNGFTFDFVGVVYTKNCVLKCYPKYIADDCSQSDFDKRYKEHYKTLLKAIKKYKEEKQQKVQFYNGEVKSDNFNRLSVMLYILNDYLENGIYTNQKTIIETNGEGEIEWDKTINETFALIKNNQPYYFNLQTINTVNNDEDFIKLIHECVVSDCFRELYDTGILDMFDIRGEEISSMTLNDLGDKEYIKYKLENELKIQYITKKQNILKTLYAYVNESQYGFDDSEYSFYGVHRFAPVWEKACSEIFDDVKEVSLKKLQKQNLIRFDDIKIKADKENRSLMHLIERAKWEFRDGFSKNSDSLKPDTISIKDNIFFIMDAKYYLVTKDDNGDISGQPGIESIVKQFAYHKAYHDLLMYSNLKQVSNSFLIPRQVKDKTDLLNLNAYNRGYVDFNLMQSYALEKLCPITVVELSPQLVFDKYLSGSKASELLTAENFSTMNIQKNISITNNFNWTNDYIANENYTMVGVLQNTYIKSIKNSKKDFYFFFYKHKGKTVYPVHNLLPCCSTFLGYISSGEDSNFLVKGKISDNGIIKTATQNELKVLLHETGYDNNSTYTADLYYVVKITDVEIIEGITISKYQAEIKEFEGNDALSEISPKVIYVDWNEIGS